MKDHLNQNSINSSENSSMAIGGLVIVMCLFAPIMILIGIAKALTLFYSGDSSTK